ncbi:MAG: DUF4091 domain-containing protein [Christensenellaceae bacterium]
MISGDEPSDMTAYRKSMEFIKNIEPNAKFKLALDHASVIEEFADSLNCCAASFPCTCKQRDFLLSFKGERRKLLFYVCNIPDHPNTVLKSRLLEAELLGVLAYKLNFDGFLRWAHYCWTKAPLENISYNTLSLPSGDVCFVYPNRRGGFLLSLRYKALQRGIQHFELLKRVPEQTACRLAEAVLLREDFSDYMSTTDMPRRGSIPKIRRAMRSLGGPCWPRFRRSPYDAPRDSADRRRRLSPPRFLFRAGRIFTAPSRDSEKNAGEL